LDAVGDDLDQDLVEGGELSRRELLGRGYEDRADCARVRLEAG
jgi:hypothetical protein